jgi:outer membrane protein assembly factor BamB
MTRVLAAGMVILMLISCASAQSTTFGWRGDGTGCFPNADPPTEWMRASKVMQGLRSQAMAPKGEGASGVSAAYGTVTEWLALGPLESQAEKPIDDDLLGGEEKAQPTEGQQVGKATWKGFAPESGIIDFSALFGKDVHGVAYAHSWLYSPTGGKVLFRYVHHDKIKAWVNGALIYPSKSAPVVGLQRGWNRVLVKAAWGKQAGPYEVSPSLWHFGMRITAAPPFESETKNIAWMTRLPSSSLAAPVIAGDRIFVMSEPWDLFCLRKSDGKVLWVRTNSFYDAATPEEKASNAFREIAPIAARLNEVNASFTKAEWPDAKLIAEKADLQKKVTSLTAAADKRYELPPGEYHGYAAGTPATDGKNVYAWFAYGVGACYDLDGNRKWIVSAPHKVKHHGHNSSPLLMGGRFFAHMRELMCFDAAGGRELWRMDINRNDELYQENFHDSLLGFAMKGEDYVFAYGQIVRAKDGARVFEDKGWQENADIPTPVIAGGMIYKLTASGRLLRARLPDSPDAISLKADSKPVGRGFDIYKRTGHAASPLHHEGLLYLVDYMGRLTVVDAKTLEAVYRRDLGLGIEVKTFVYPLGTCYSSPTLVGKHIVVLGAEGTSVVFEPGRTFKLVARNKIEHATNPGMWYELPEGFVPAPIAEGKRMYLRGSEYLYCVGK